MFRVGAVLLRASPGFRSHEAANPLILGGLSRGYSVESVSERENRANNANVVRLISAYRKYGHLHSSVNPLGKNSAAEVDQAKLDLSYYGLDAESEVLTEGLVTIPDANGIIRETASISSIVSFLQSAYAGHRVAQFSHITNSEERQWLYREWEKMSSEAMGSSEQKRILSLLVDSEMFDDFLQKRRRSTKRYGLEGCESMIPSIDHIFRAAAGSGVEHVVIGMPHRGRLNALATVMEYPIESIFHKIDGNLEFDSSYGFTGDVLSHLGLSHSIRTVEDHTLQLSLLQNPSHLEAVNPVAMGKTRAKQFYGTKSLCLLLHGDAAFAGQGVVAESLNMATLPYFTVGGTVHVTVNNQLGFTTEPVHGRSSRYSPDMGRAYDMPIMHVNAEHPEDVVRVSKLAVRYQQRFKKDILVDLLGWRYRGHNELDDPTFTNPLMCQRIYDHPTIATSYAASIGATEAEVQALKQAAAARYDAAEKRAATFVPTSNWLKGPWTEMVPVGNCLDQVASGVDLPALFEIGAKSVAVPDGFMVHDRLQKSHVSVRAKKMADIAEAVNIDWATAETLAFGSLLKDGFNVRLSGQEVGRGTFAHRHVVLYDQNTGSAHREIVPLNRMGFPAQGQVEVAPSPLSEFAVLGFEYGYATEHPKHLCLWEAQFGDFFNGAQIIIDQFIASGEEKWLRQNGLVLLLPHGMDGAGPDHSSARPERWLSMVDTPVYAGVDASEEGRVNLQVAFPTTPANYFHLLRRQMVRKFRKPLVVFSPKTLLRDNMCTSTLAEFDVETAFQPVISDAAPGSTPSKVVFCTGKYYYNLVRERKAKEMENDVAIIRLEELAPFPFANIANALSPLLANDPKIMWVQEEHENSGFISYVYPRLKHVLASLNTDLPLHYVGRSALATSAVGYKAPHEYASKELMQKVFE